jgi:hypothetical protein
MCSLWEPCSARTPTTAIAAPLLRANGTNSAGDVQLEEVLEGRPAREELEEEHPEAVDVRHMTFIFCVGCLNRPTQKISFLLSAVKMDFYFLCQLELLIFTLKKHKSFFLVAHPS